MSHLTKAQITEQLLKGSGQAGSGGRSRALGENDPRHRRGAQSEGVAMQRFDPDHLKVDDEQRITLVDPPKSTVIAAASLSLGAANPLDGADTFENLPLSTASTSVNTGADAVITLNNSADTVTLRAGRVYLAHAEGIFRNAHGATAKNGTIRIAKSDSSSTYGSRTASVSSAATAGAGGGTTASRLSISVSGILDLREAAEDAEIAIQVKGIDTNIIIDSGWATIQTL